ncbi:MAG: histidinol-phosphate aminotransferase family protein [Methanoregula sp.]|nr:histidinol-phosphate aminotransferase family protein [Methanoregula sp.]
MAGNFPKRVIHGGTGKREREKTRKPLLDFSASLNPQPPGISWSFDPASLSFYPDNDYVELKEIIAHTFHRDPSEVCVGNGSIELIRVFCSVYLSRGSTFFAETPTFGEYALSARLAGAEPVSSVSDATVCFVCNPNNPTGTLHSRLNLLNGLNDITSPDRMIFADEAFIELADPAQSLSDVRDDQLFVLRSLTKSFSVPGIRFGYGFGDPDLIEKIEIARPPWSVNAYAEAFAREAFRHIPELEASREYIRKEREWLDRQIRDLGYSPCPSSVNYILVNCSRNAGPLCRQLEDCGILVRDCTSFGLPASIRVAVRTHKENMALVEALSACVH